jgi:hypothetical protein
MSRLADLRRFYSLLDELEQRTGGRRSLASLSQFRDWPQRGVYIFIDSNEPRQTSGDGDRVVRVGTHALTSGSKSTLRQRLGQHRGTLSGGGNHRGSIFRLLVGQALLASGSQPPCLSWGVKGDKRKACEAVRIDRPTLDALEGPIEQVVSQYLSGLSFLWLDIGDDPSPNSQRGLIERHSIALLSNQARPPLDSPSQHWLGQFSNRPLVRESGLWNQRHVDETYDSNFLDVFEDLI